MQTEKLKLTDIKIGDRVRQDMGEINELAASIKKYGLCNPLLLGPENQLIDGGRRVAACRLAGLVEVPIIRRETLTPEELVELEYECNYRRLDFTWQELVICACRIHKKHEQEAALRGEKWTQTMTGALLGGYSHTYVWQCLNMEAFMTQPEHPVYKCDTITDAVRLLAKLREDEALARLQQLATTAMNLEATGGPSILGRSPEEIATVMANWTKAERNKAVATQQPTMEVPLSQSFILGDCIDYMLTKRDPDSVDHIVTDPPYGIDMDNLDQEKSMIDTSRIATTHDVEDNLKMFPKMMRGFFRVLREGGYCVLFCDIMNWNVLYLEAITAGFKVQRWPLVWVKLHTCKNQAAHVNFTKSVELAMVCRKGKAVLPAPVGFCHIQAANDAKLSNTFAKPFDVWKFIIESISIKGQLIFDPFAGEGSSVLAVWELLRRAAACEIDEKHYNVLMDSARTWITKSFEGTKIVFS